MHVFILIIESILADLNNISRNSYNYSMTNIAPGLGLQKRSGVDTIAITISIQEQSLIEYKFNCSSFSFG